MKYSIPVYIFTETVHETLPPITNYCFFKTPKMAVAGFIESDHALNVIGNELWRPNNGPISYYPKEAIPLAIRGEHGLSWRNAV